MKPLRIVMMLVAACLVTSTAALAMEIKLKLQGDPRDQKEFLTRLNNNGKNQDLTFVVTETGYDYRVVVYAEAATGADIVFETGGADASAAVLTPDCDLLFIVSRADRASKRESLNALSKELIKKLKAHLSKKAG